MRKLLWLKQQSSYNHEEKKPEAGRTLSLGEYRRAISWSKYLVTSGAEIKLKGEGDQEWSADMSQLFIGNKFASGKHSRIYRGIYKQRDVAIKLISQPLEDEDLASFLEKQFSSEVALLFQLCHHPNIITGFTGTYRWMAPEMIKEKHHTKKVDVYSFGIVMWELFTALTPFDNMTPEQAAFAVSQKNARPPLPVTCPTAFSHLINRCWSSNPGKRPHFDEIVAILESYSESLSRNPDFFSKYKPKHEHGTLGRFGKCIAVRPSKSHLSFPS
ncbi:Serine/threonine/tyrosine-protein kinase HT1 [Linum perenne]